MRLATRTGLAALVSTVVATLVLTAIAGVLLPRRLLERVDDQLEDRAATAPVLAAVGDRIAVSELNGTVDAARIATADGVVGVGSLPDDPLPELNEPGWRTVRADGEDWRLYAVSVADVPVPGDEALVELAEPLGDVQAQARRLRRLTFWLGALTAVVVGAVGWLAGRRAARPLTGLRDDAARLATDGGGWQVRASSGTPEVDEVAGALNHTLARVAAETARRDEALAAARAFASAASHELRTPLQSAMTNLDVALAGDPAGDPAVAVARGELTRMASALAAIRSIADAELVDPTSFEPVDLADVADGVVTAALAGGAAPIELAGARSAPVVAWADGVRLAVDNLVRNAVAHGRRADGAPPRVVVTVTASPPSVAVDDDGPGVPAADRERVLQRFVHGPESAGSGLGLSFVAEVAAAHGGTVTIADSPLGGARVVLALEVRQ